MQRIQRKRTISKIYSDFVECAKIVNPYPYLVILGGYLGSYGKRGFTQSLG